MERLAKVVIRSWLDDGHKRTETFVCWCHNGDFQSSILGIPTVAGGYRKAIDSFGYRFSIKERV